MSVKAIKQFTKDQIDLDKISKLIKQGEVVAAPTETAYGLITNALNKVAVTKIYKIKGREFGKPCPIILADIGQVKKYFVLNSIEKKLASKFWPGPLTLVLQPRKQIWPKTVTNKYGKVGVRITSSKWLRELIVKTSYPLTATSANLAGEPTLYSFESVIKQLFGRGLKFVVVGPKLKKISTSTVVEVVNNKLVIYRSGLVKEKKLISVLN